MKESERKRLLKQVIKNINKELNNNYASNITDKYVEIIMNTKIKEKTK
jgi:uncharacterized protein YpuA (DUF1002 family)